MVWKLAGLPGGTWQTFTLAACAGSAPNAVETVTNAATPVTSIAMGTSFFMLLPLSVTGNHSILRDSSTPLFRREKPILSKRSRKPAIGALKPGPEPCAPETVQMVRPRLSYAGRPPHAERHGDAHVRDLLLSARRLTPESRPIANSRQEAFVRPTGAVETVSRTICPELVRTVRRPVFQGWIAHFRHRLYKIGFSRREGGIVEPDPSKRCRKSGIRPVKTGLVPFAPENRTNGPRPVRSDPSERRPGAPISSRRRGSQPWLTAKRATAC